MNTLTTYLGVAAFLGGLCAFSVQQQVPLMDHGLVQHHGASATVLASEARPLSQAVTALRDEYGWTVDFEDPPYESDQDLVDGASPQWRATHPNSRGLMIPAGRSFRSEYPEKPNTATSLLEEEKILNLIVADYNRSGNPGKFALRDEGNGRYAIVGESIKDNRGQDRRVTPLLDTPISIPTASRSVGDTIDLILAEVSSRTGCRALPVGGARNPAHPLVSVGGENIPARTLLMQALAGYRTTQAWILLFDANEKTYYFSLTISKIQQNVFGGKMRTPADRSK